ncbi:MAG: hypothetical protein CMQ07_08855 [Gammaproteobacteria bacterium]|nr:hypothetical protein [Gammaproteobacteria bacterium]
MCRAELESLLAAKSELLDWQDQSVPHWDRGLELFKREHQVAPGSEGWFSNWQWLPTAASFAMLCILLFNTSIAVNETGLQIAFGSATASEEVARTLTAFEAQQIDEIETLIRRFEARQDSSNIQLLQAVMEQTQQSTAESLDRIYAYFEEQRLQDLQDMQLGYQQLADSDYATLRSLQELAQYVSFQEAPR